MPKPPSRNPRIKRPAKLSRAGAKNSAATFAQRRARVARILPLLKAAYPDAKCSLDYRTPLELLVATILSAQCTDVRVNLVTPALFKKYRTAAAYAAADPRELEREIQTTGFFRSKTRSIQAMAKSLIENHKGQVPRTMEELTSLHGVGRKTANVVLGNAFDTAVGIVVDTHVTRVSNRLGLTDHATDAVKIEQDLMKVVPQSEWTLFSHLLIHHGRAICRARNPLCEECPLLPNCPAGKQFVAEAGAAGKKS
jgi:endonuclease-3